MALKLVQTRVNEKTFRALKSIAKADGRTLAGFVRMVLEEMSGHGDLIEAVAAGGITPKKALASLKRRLETRMETKEAGAT